MQPTRKIGIGLRTGLYTVALYSLSLAVSPAVSLISLALANDCTPDTAHTAPLDPKLLDNLLATDRVLDNAYVGTERALPPPGEYSLVELKPVESDGKPTVKLPANRLAQIKSIASHVSVKIGETLYQRRGDDIWYQEPFEHHTPMTALGYEVTVTGKAGEIPALANIQSPFGKAIVKHTSASIGYANFGNVNSSALATASDPNYAICKNNTSLCWPLSHWYGRSSSAGVYGKINETFGRVTASVGVIADKDFFDMKVPDYHRGPSPTEPTESVEVHGDEKVRLQPIASIGVRVTGSGEVELTMAEVSNSELYPTIFHNQAWNLGWRQKF